MNIKLTAFPTLAMLLALTLSTQSHATGFHSCEATDEADWATVEALKKRLRQMVLNIVVISQMAAAMKSILNTPMGVLLRLTITQ